MFKNALILAVALTGLVACGKKDDAAAPATPTPAAAAPTTAAPVADAGIGAGLPQACEAYLTRAKACFDKSNPQTAAAFQQGVDQAKAQWPPCRTRPRWKPAASRPTTSSPRWSAR